MKIYLATPHSYKQIFEYNKGGVMNIYLADFSTPYGGKTQIEAMEQLNKQTNKQTNKCKFI